MDNRPIGVFDSGLGGLTAVRELMRIMPDENIVFFGDNARVPYGTRPAIELRRLAQEGLDLVASYGAKAVLVACGTLSSNAADVIDEYAVPSFGVIEPAAQAAAAAKGDAPIGVIATAATVKSGVFESKLNELCPGREVISIACPDFVTLIESGRISSRDSELMQTVERYLAPLKEAGIKTLILGCTHFGLISHAIGLYLGSDVELISAAECASARLKEYIESNGISGGNGERLYITSGCVEEFSAISEVLIGTQVHGKVIHREVG